MNFAEKWSAGLTYSEFLDKYASPEQRRRWDDIFALVGPPSGEDLPASMQYETVPSGSR